ncbi:MAG: hypothetical protein K2X50_08170 [Gammaproteobacteria bacterium]|nr:hypothetical protein [Gammaproteobacteria bacterium]
MKNVLKSILILSLGSVFNTAFATDHGGYPANYWSLHNHCVNPVLFVIKNEAGQIELEKLLKGGEGYHQQMDHGHTMFETEYKMTYETYLVGNKNTLTPIDNLYSNSWDGFVGTIHVNAPYFYYNKSLDNTGCMP